MVVVFGGVVLVVVVVVVVMSMFSTNLVTDVFFMCLEGWGSKHPAYSRYWQGSLAY